MLAALTAVAALAPASAGAAGTSRVLVDRAVNHYVDSADCADYGPYDFVNEFSGTERVQVSDVFARDGTRLQTVVQIVREETEHNSVTGSTLPLKQAAREVWDYPSSTRTISGSIWLGAHPGGGTYVQDTGRITIPFDTRIASFIAGPHEAFFTDLDELVCKALAA
jgi:hypothetical protein